MRILTFLMLAVVVGTGHAWAQDEEYQFGHITYNGTAANDGGTLTFYTSSKDAEQGQNAVAPNGTGPTGLTDIMVKNDGEWESVGTGFFVMATPAVGHRLPAPAADGTVSFIHAEVVTQAQQAPSRRNAPDPTLEVGQALDVKFYGYYSGNSFGDDPATEYYGLYYVVMPADENLSVSITATFPEVEKNTEAISYVDADGTTQTKAAGEVYVLDGTEARLGYGSYNNRTEHETWYVLPENATYNYTNGLELYGKVHLILADGGTMTIGTDSKPIEGSALYVLGNLDIYGQSGQSGTLNATTSSNHAINLTGDLAISGGVINAKSDGYSGIKSEHFLTINGGTVTSTSTVDTGISAGSLMTINGGTVTGIGTKVGIHAGGDLIINGGQVTGIGGTGETDGGLYSRNGNIILGWTNPTDFIKASSYLARNDQTSGMVVKTAEGQRFVAYNMANESDVSASAIASGTVNDVTLLAGKTLKPLDGNYIEATSGLQIGSLNGKDFTVRDADFSIDYAHYYLFSAAAEDVVVYYSNEYLPSDYHSIVWNVTGTSLKAYNYFGSGPRNMDNRYATFDMPGNADVTIDYENGGDGRMYQMPGGPLGSDSYWELSEDGSVLILDGTGDITVEKVDEWVNYNIKSISFSESVHYINNEVFAGLTHLETVSIGKNVERIGNGVFSGCTSLASVTFPLLEYPSAINIGNGVFAGCTSLTSVTFQDTKVPTIGTDVFPENLTTIIVPAAALQSYYNATSWANYKTLLVASGSCGKTESDHVTWTLTRLATGYEVATEWEDVEPYNPTATTTVPAYKLTISGTGAMADYDGEGVTTPWAAADFHFPAGEWQDSYSDKSVITELEIGAGITALGANAFTGLSNLTSLTIATGSALTTIAPADFAGYHTTVTLPTTVTTIDLKNNPATLDGALRNAAWHAYHERFTRVGGYCGTTADDADGHNLSWTLEWKGEDADDNGHYPLTLTITGTGAMADYGDSYETQAPWKGFFTILSPLPDGLTTIGNFAFNYGAISGALNIPESVTSIGNFAFNYCAISGTLDIPTSVTSIGEWAFQNCSGLTAVNILGAKDAQGNALTTIDQAAFRDNSNLATVNLGDGVKYIGNNAFCRIGITEVTIPASVEFIGFCAFASCPSLKTVRTNRGEDGSITEFGHNDSNTYNQFDNCTSLETIIVPATGLLSYLGADGWSAYADKVISTGYCGKDDTETEDVDESHNVIWTLAKNTGEKIEGNEPLTLTISKNPEVTAEGADFSMADGWPFGSSDEPTTALSITQAVIGDGVTSIGESAFSVFENMATVSIPSSVTSIGTGAFLECKSLANITIPDGVRVINNSTFNGCAKLTTVVLPSGLTTIGASAFAGCEILNSIGVAGSTTNALPTSLTTIGVNAFTFSGLPAITLNEELKTIGDGAFSPSKLTTINIPASVENIGEDAFTCFFLESISVADGNTHFTTDGNVALLTSDGTTLLTYARANTETTSYAVPDGVTRIGAGAFNGSHSLTEVTLPEGLVTIGDQAFQNCDAITDIAIPASVESIGANGFCECDKLAMIRVFRAGDDVNSITTIGAYTFYLSYSAPAYSSRQIYVPLSALETYRDAENWTAYTSWIVAGDETELFSSATNAWMTWCSDKAYGKPVGCKAYTVSAVSGGEVTLTPVAGLLLPAYTPLLIKRDDTSAPLTAICGVAVTEPASGYNATTGLVTKTETGFSMLGAAKDDPVSGSITAGYSYALFDGEFLKIDDSTLSIPAHRCILTLPEPLSASRLSIVDGNGDTTGIISVHSSQSIVHSEADAWYTLDGRKLDKQPTVKGLYIHNGRKVVIK